MKNDFALSESNKVYFGCVAAISFVLFLVTSDKTSYQIGEFVGRLIGFLFMPLIFAWIVWRLSGKREKSGSVTFNIMLTLILIGQIAQFGNKLQQSQQLEDLQKKKQEFKDEFSSTENAVESGDAYNKYTDSVKEGLNKLSETSTGSEKRVYRILSDFTSETQAIYQSWNQSLDAVLSQRILDYSLLVSDEEFEYQKKTLNHYVAQSESYRDYFATMIPRLEKRLKALGEGNKFAAGALKGATKKHFAQKPIMEPLMAAYIDYGNNMIQILDLLQKSKGEWVYESDELSIYSDEVLNDFNELIEKLGGNEAAINTLSESLIEVM